MNDEVSNVYHRTLDYWRGLGNERLKLQWIYAAVAVVGLIVAGLIGLVDQDLAQNLLQVVYAAAILLIVNFVVWVIVTALFDETPSHTPAAPRAKKPAARSRK